MKKRIDWSTADSITKCNMIATAVMGWWAGKDGFWYNKEDCCQAWKKTVIVGFSPDTEPRDLNDVMNHFRRYDFSLSNDGDGWFCHIRESYRKGRIRPDKEAVVHNQPTMADAILICALRVSGVEVTV